MKTLGTFRITRRNKIPKRVTTLWLSYFIIKYLLYFNANQFLWNIEIMEVKRVTQYMVPYFASIMCYIHDKLSRVGKKSITWSHKHNSFVLGQCINYHFPSNDYAHNYHRCIHLLHRTHHNESCCFHSSILHSIANRGTCNVVLLPVLHIHKANCQNKRWSF